MIGDPTGAHHPPPLSREQSSKTQKLQGAGSSRFSIPRNRNRLQSPLMGAFTSDDFVR